MKLIGLTGGVGMGKSTASRFLQARGLPVADTDLIARELVHPGSAGLAEVAAAFGRDVLTPAGELNRAALAAIVFADPSARRRLEAILHPRIRAEWLRRAEAWRVNGAPVGVVMIPLLFETDAASHFDWVVCVGCSEPTQILRLAERGWDPAEIARRNAAQLPLEQKMAGADFVVWTEGRLSRHEQQWDRVLRECQ
jgi:dephospho-CoA kinase